MNKITHIITGGTILGQVPEYKEVGELAGIFDNTIDVEKYLVHSLKVGVEIETKEVCMKDSRDITDLDRKMIQTVIEQSFEGGVRLFLITHGTYTMPDTGIFLKTHISKDILENVSIIITGAMYPTNFIGSDALLNLGASVAGLLNAEKPLGVKICMHGRYWNPEDIEKDVEHLIFKKKQNSI